VPEHILAGDGAHPTALLAPTQVTVWTPVWGSAGCTDASSVQFDTEPYNCSLKLRANTQQNYVPSSKQQ